MSTTSPIRSTFVTLTAWIALCFSGLPTYGVLSEVAAGHWSTFTDPFGSSWEEFQPTPEEQEQQAWVDRLVHPIVLGLCLITPVMFVSSVGLLFRKNWARLLFIFTMCATILWCGYDVVVLALVNNLGGLVFPVTLGIAALSAWVALKFRSAAVVREFANVGARFAG
jgi:hypothetical protein